jgi:hypothetical protein
MVAAELAFLTATPDAEAQLERLARRAAGLENSSLLKQESHQTSYAYLLMERGERSRAGTLLAEALKRGMRERSTVLAELRTMPFPAVPRADHSPRAR